MIRSVLHYVSSIWTSCDKENLNRIFKLQKRAARVISNANNQAAAGITPFHSLIIFLYTLYIRNLMFFVILI
ncbi:unnamed protein product [Porites lobata]|uniref:Uncharacterized protein n=1 Tax=Porites lobata TaxID=104759 RepID=A0ABN8NQB1_9CNID|nr:unnamed protein product [Porites lobata]